MDVVLAPRGGGGRHVKMLLASRDCHIKQASFVLRCIKESRLAFDRLVWDEMPNRAPPASRCGELVANKLRHENDGPLQPFGPVDSQDLDRVRRDKTLVLSR